MTLNLRLSHSFALFLFACAGGQPDDQSTFASGSGADGADDVDGESTDTQTGTDTEGGQSCGAGTTDCEGVCVVLDSDPNNCGTCGNVCPGGQACIAGSCAACDAPMTDCGGACVDTTNDPEHCGGCNQPCDSLCSQGECVEQCTPPTELCDDLCVDTTNDPDHCGACGNACNIGEPCVAGECMGAPADPCELDPCNGRGWCNLGSCECDVGYGGADCTSCTDSWQQTGPGLCEPAMIVDGTEAGENLDGTGGIDRVRGLGGNDYVRGLDGSDLVNGNQGVDEVNGNVGRDEVRGGSEDDIVRGGGDNDVLFGDVGNDQLFGDLGVDRLIGGSGNDTLEGGGDNDRFMIDGLGDDVFSDEGGSDTARCLPGITAISDAMIGADRVLVLNTGGSVTIVDNAVESVLGCN